MALGSSYLGQAYLGQGYPGGGGSPPPPTPPVSDPSLLAAALASDQRVVTVVEVWTGPTATAQPAKIRDISANVTVATWTEDESRSPRWTCSVTIESQGRPTDDLVPLAGGDLLHPLSGNEIRIFHGFRFPDGSQELAPCGVYRISKPQINDDGTKVEITINGNDRSVEVDKRRWTNPYPITTTPTVDAAILAGMQDRFPGLTYNLTPTTLTVPQITLGTQGSSSSGGPMADFIQLATAAGMELFFDDVGVVTLRPVPVPTQAPVAMGFVEGSTCTMVSITRTLDETKTYNGVVATSSAAGTAAPISASVWVSDPTSPLNPATFGYVPYFYTSPFITTGPQATSAATAILQTLLTAYDDTAFTAVGNAALRCGNVIAITRARSGVTGNFVASQITMSSDPTQLMSVINRARRAAA